MRWRRLHFDNCTNQFANVAKTFSTSFSRVLYFTTRYTINGLYSTNQENVNVNIIMAKDISFWGRQWNFSTPACMTWMRMRLILSIFSIALQAHKHTLERMNITFLPYPRTHRLMKRNGCGVLPLPAYHLNELIISFYLFVCVLAAKNIIDRVRNHNAFI